MNVVLTHPPQAAIGSLGDASHWIAVVDARGQHPDKLLGPYATEQLAGRARRGVMRLLNVSRYTATVLSQRELECRLNGDGTAPARSQEASRAEANQVAPTCA